MNQSPTDDSNPYTPASPAPPAVDPSPITAKHPQWKIVLTGVLWSVFSAFPMAALMALVFRFPIPFAGYLSGPNAVIPALFAVLLYGVLGGFVLLGVLGAIGGVVTSRLLPQHPYVRVIVCFVSVGITFICLLVLAILDYIVGPW